MVKFHRLKQINIDIETFCDVDIGKCGAYKYAAAPAFEILLFAYAVDGGPVEVVDLAQGEQIPADIVRALNDPNVVKYAYNATFEYLCLRRFYKTDVRQWRCTMVRGAAAGYPLGLARFGKAIGLPEELQKNTRGSQLIRLFSVPQRDGSRVRPHDKPDEWQEFREYCRQDVRVEAAGLAKLHGHDLSDDEWEQWALNVEINDRGVPVNVELVDKAIDIWDAERAQLHAEAVRLTGLENPNSRNQLKAWLESELNDELPDVRKSTLQALLEREDIPEHVIKAIQTRARLGKTSIAKYHAMKNAVMADGRVRGTLSFYGARTGRFAGRLIQPQNMPRDCFDDPETEREFLRTADHAAWRERHDDTAHALSKLIRNVIEAPRGSRFIVCDYSAIEARVLAWLAGEQWVMDVFAGEGKIYEQQAARMLRIPIAQVDKEARQRGKATTLACGYQGGPQALINLGALEMGIAESDLPRLVRQYRDANPNIVNFWHGLNERALLVTQTGRRMRYRGLILALKCGDLCITLPSGRVLVYPEPSETVNQRGDPAVQFRTWKGNRGWINEPTYGGKLTENVVQAIARDCLTAAILRLERAGYRTILHVHDEVVIEARDGFGRLEEVRAIMAEPLPWAEGLLLNAEGFESTFYKKD